MPLSTALLLSVFSLPGMAADVSEASLQPSIQPAIQTESSSNVLIAKGADEERLSRGYLARIAQNSPQDLEAALKRAEMLFLEGSLKGEVDPAVFVIHGPEVAVFFRDNYFRYRSLVDLAARLSSFGVIDIRVCETRMGVLGREREALMPFVGTVPFGPAEEVRLLEAEGYVHF
ncbi:hypothetical protein R50073_03550 [Maricurvus nonylphenolicus]